MKKKNNKKVARYFWTKWGEYMPVYPDRGVLSAWEWEPAETQSVEVLNIVLYPKDLHISDSKIRTKKFVPLFERKKRSSIRAYSFRANKRCKFYLRNTASLMEVMIDLTYPNDYPMDGEVVKKQLHKFTSWLRYRDYKYFWVLEFQERGAPHFHFIVDKTITYKDVANVWYKIVSSGDTKHLKAGTRVAAIRRKNSMAYYLTKYMNKSEQKIVPKEYQKVGRFWGHSKDLLQPDIIKIYGSPKDMCEVKRAFKITRKFDVAQKRQWEKRDKELGKPKNKFKKYYYQRKDNTKRKPPYSLRVINSDKIRAELLKHGMDFLPDYLLGLALPPSPTATTIVAPWSGGSEPAVETIRLELTESYEDMLKRLGLY
jgi:hypothetical protein